MSQVVDSNDAQKLATGPSQEWHAGALPEDVTAELDMSELSREAASPDFGQSTEVLQNAYQDDQLTAPKLLMALLGACFAAIVCGVMWSVIAVQTDTEFGLIAWVVGLVSGAAVTLTTKARGVLLQIVAVVASVGGIFVGKYLIMAHVVKQQIAEQEGADVAADVAYFSIPMVQFFAENVQHLLTPFDLLWCGLAIATAWKMPARKLTPGMTLPN